MYFLQGTFLSFHRWSCKSLLKCFVYLLDCWNFWCVFLICKSSHSRIRYKCITFCFFLNALFCFNKLFDSKLVVLRVLFRLIQLWRSRKSKWARSFKLWFIFLLISLTHCWSFVYIYILHVTIILFGGFIFHRFNLSFPPLINKIRS